MRVPYSSAVGLNACSGLLGDLFKTRKGVGRALGLNVRLSKGMLSILEGERCAAPAYSATPGIPQKQVYRKEALKAATLSSNRLSMGNNDFFKVFDVLDSGFNGWIAPSLVLGMVFMFISYHDLIPYFVYKRPLIFFVKPYFSFRNLSHNFLLYAGLLSFSILALFMFVDRYSQYLRHKALVLENRCNIIEGQVQSFSPKTRKGGYEYFSVSGVKFRYSSDDETDAFNGRSPLRGLINNEFYVRICYDPADKAILRLETQG